MNNKIGSMSHCVLGHNALDIPKCEICEQHDVQITCINCGVNFCKACDEQQHSKGKFKEHQRQEYSGLIPSRFCTIKGHEQQPLALFCQTCSKLICGLCVVDDHKTHTYVRAEVATENAKEILKDSIVPLQATITEAETEIKKTQEEIKVLQSEIKQKKEKIKEAKKKIDENLQRIEEIKSVLGKNEVDSFTLLSMVSNLKKVNINPRIQSFSDKQKEWHLDLIFVVQEKKHPLFTRDGNDLIYKKQITSIEASLGTSFTVKTLNGEIITVDTKDEIISLSTRKRISNKGMPIKNLASYGDLFIEFDITIPKKLTNVQRKKIQELELWNEIFSKI